MFSRITYDSFQLLFPMIGFFIFAAVFIVAVTRACLMKKSNVTRLSALPLQEAEMTRPTCRHDQPQR